MRSNTDKILLSVALVLAVSSYVYNEQMQTTNSEPLKLVSTEVETPDFAAIENITERKSAFFDFLKPGILAENQRVAGERERLIKIRDAFEAKRLSHNDLEYARQLGDSYSNRFEGDEIPEGWIDDMLLKVNLLPPALVLTQAANESAWGTSRFATEANNYFGQWCYVKGCGLVPLHRAEGASHEVAKFKSVTESIHRYFMNVNRNRAYASLRQIRADLESDGESLLSPEAANDMAYGLLKYSERGEAYVSDLQAMIRVNSKYWKTDEQ